MSIRYFDYFLSKFEFN